MLIFVMFRMFFLSVLWCCFWIADAGGDENSRPIHRWPEKRVLIKSHAYGQLIMFEMFEYKHGDSLTLRCLMTPINIVRKYRYYINFTSTENNIQNYVIRKSILISANKSRILKCLLYQWLTRQHADRNHDESKYVDQSTAVAYTNKPASTSNNRRERVLNTSYKKPTGPGYTVRPTTSSHNKYTKSSYNKVYKPTTFKPKLFTVSKSKPATSVKVRQRATTLRPKLPTTPKGHRVATFSIANKNSKAPNKVVATNTPVMDRAPIPALTVLRPIKEYQSSNPAKTNFVNRLIITAKDKYHTTETKSDWEEHKTVWITLSVVGVCIFVLCLIVVIYKIKKRNCNAQTNSSSCDLKMECHYSASKDQTTIYSVPFGPGLPTPSNDGPINTGPRPENNGEIHYASLDIVPSNRLPKKNVSEDSPYAEVFADVSGRICPVRD